MDRFAVIGLGRFGSRLATTLAAAGAEVIAIDRDRAIVEDLRDEVTLAIAMDSTDEQALKIQGVDQVDCAVVGIGADFEANALTTALLKSLGVKRVIARAATRTQARILSRIGADGVVSPEEESADRWANKLLAPFLLDRVEIGDGYVVAQVRTPAPWSGKTLAELDLRRAHNITMVAIRRKARPDGSARTTDASDEQRDRVVELPQPTSRLQPDDLLVVAGFDEELKRLPH